MIHVWLIDIIRAGRGTMRTEDAQGTSTQSHIFSSILVYEDRISSFEVRCVVIGAQAKNWMTFQPEVRVEARDSAAYGADTGSCFL